MAKEFTGLRLEPHIEAAVKELARIEHRTKTNMIETILLSWFRDKHPELIHEPERE